MNVQEGPTMPRSRIGRWSLKLMAIAGLYSVVRERERSLAVFMTTTLGLLVLAYAIAEVASRP